MGPRPDVLVIMTDQQQARCLGCAGHPDLQTPHLDALAADGTRYANSFCPYPVCTPSRYSFLTGRHVHQHLGWTNFSTIPPAMPTWPKALRTAGYRTACVGKMHFHPTYLDVGFDTMVLAEQNGPGRDDDDYHRYLRDLGLHDRIDLWDQVREFRDQAPEAYWDSYGAIESNLPEAHHSTTWIGDRCLEQLQAWDPAGGNCLMASFIKPHHPFDPPAPWSRMYDPEALELPPGWLEAPLARDLARHGGFFPHAELSEARLRRCMALYYATISQIDHQVGRLVDHLRASGRYDDTVILFTADHGEYLGFHHLLFKQNHMYDPLMRVPLVIKPVGGGAGAVDESLVNNLDVAPTLCAAAGVEWGHGPGRDLAAGGPGPEVVIAENGAPDGYMVRSHEHKLIVDRDPTRSLFFDLVDDPHELENRLDDPRYAEAITAFHQRLARWSLFDCPSPVYRDADAPVCPGDNVLAGDGEHRETSRAYWRRCMAE